MRERPQFCQSPPTYGAMQRIGGFCVWDAAQWDPHHLRTEPAGSPSTRRLAGGASCVSGGKLKLTKPHIIQLLTSFKAEFKPSASRQKLLGVLLLDLGERLTSRGLKRPAARPRQRCDVR